MLAKLILIYTSNQVSNYLTKLILLTFTLVAKHKKLLLVENNIAGTQNIVCEHVGHTHQIA